MIDMHTHILPGIDDGASSLEESLRILKKGRSEGIRTFVLTPHIKEEADWDKLEFIQKTYDTLCTECKKIGLEATLILGAEVAIIPDLAEKLKKHISVIIKGRYLLVELPFHHLPVYVDEVLFKLLTGNIIPIIAHPERYLYLNNNLKKIETWIENGTMLQINTGSLQGQYGMRVKWLAKKLLKNNFVHFLGSDVHSREDIYSSFTQVYNKIESKITDIS